MSTEKTELTPEQEQAQIENINQQTAAFEFRRAHPRFKSSKPNAEILRDYLIANNLPWTVEALNQAYEAEQAKLDLNEPYKAPEPPPNLKLEEKVLPAWGELKTKRDVVAIPRDKYTKWLKDPAFVKEVNDVLRRAQ